MTGLHPYRTPPASLFPFQGCCRAGWVGAATGTSPGPRRNERIACGGSRLGGRFGGSGRMTEEAGGPGVSPAASGCFRLDAEAPGYLDDPYPVFHALRSQSPVYLAPGGVWYLSRFDDVTAVLSDGRFVRQPPAGAAPIRGHSRADRQSGG